MRDIAQRGVVMIGTAHGTDIHSLLNNHELSDLVGGVSSVTIGDAEASKTRSVGRSVGRLVGWSVGQCIFT